jgi:hypothetical protein
MTTHPIPSAGETQCDIILAVLEQARGEWVPMTELAAAAGCYAVHSRISDLRARGHDIPRPRLHHTHRGGRRICESAYRLVRADAQSSPL